MCGIFGIVASERAGIPSRTLERGVERMFTLSESRGKDASGVLSVLQDEIRVSKMPERARELMKSRPFVELVDASIRDYEAGRPFVVAGHTRMVTNGSEEDDGNNQPVIKGHHILLHNGIIVNDVELWEANPQLARKTQVDTEIFGALLEEARRKGATFAEAMAHSFAVARGANTIMAFGAADDDFIVGTTNGSSYYWRNAEGTLTIFGSERSILERVVEVFRGNSPPRARGIVHLRPKECIRISLATSAVEPFGFSAPVGESGTAHRPVRKVVAFPRPGRPPLDRHVFRNECSMIERLMGYDLDGMDRLRRCAKCLLPETFPFIEFDAAGVCQHCRSHQPRKLGDIADLRRLAGEVPKTRGDQPDCLVPISGGRDSCYGLHYVKNVLGLKPVAYTYDWGFVTDLARRNISRMCEHLEVEHILVAADIRRKRENVRKNVEAWLRRPQLGMIPLFMAGDKMYFHYASALRRQMGLGSVIFSMNWLEQTGFKAGFCGVNEKQRHQKTYGLTNASKARMVAYYFGEFARNPAYVNGSLPDTAFGFLSYYLRGKDYFSLFDYLPWDQKEIERTIIARYDWEISPDSRSTWRIGDGTAPFYNYIYLTVAGFSEHDTFRSNQIREGMITRETALALVREENRPRVESFKWYCDTVGLDAERVLKTVNAIPKLYAR
jgi:glutamine---fructose-6-phosphate transaminase (isomerizing)